MTRLWADANVLLRFLTVARAMRTRERMAANIAIRLLVVSLKPPVKAIHPSSSATIPVE